MRKRQASITFVLITLFIDVLGMGLVIPMALAGLGFDYILLSLAPTIWWLVLGRIVAGIFGATFTPVGAYIADVSSPEKRAANFGLIGVAFGLGFIAGPAVGGLLGETNLRLPFMVCAGLTFLNFLFGLLVMPESLRPENRRSINWTQMNPIGALRAVWRYRAVAAMVPVFLATQIAQQGD